MDVRDEASVRPGVAGGAARAGRLDGLVCNAGFGIFGSVEEVSLADAQAQLDTNFFGDPAHAARRAAAAAQAPRQPRRAGRLARRTRADSLPGALLGVARRPSRRWRSRSTTSCSPPACTYRSSSPATSAPASTTASTSRPPTARPTASASRAAARWSSARSTTRRRRSGSRARSGARSAIARPRFRYAVGREAPLVAIGRRLLPDRLDAGGAAAALPALTLTALGSPPSTPGAAVEVPRPRACAASREEQSWATRSSSSASA